MVNIYEQPVKPVVDPEDGVTVYVPGYSNLGPTEPTMCYSVDDFESIFGSQPFLFESTSEYNGQNFINGSPEKGYLYAKGLLSSGLRVLFHRIPSSEEEYIAESHTFKIGNSGPNSTVEFKLLAKYPGKAYSGIEVILTKSSESGLLYKIEVKDKSGQSIGNETFSIDPDSSIYFKSIDLPLVKIVGFDGKELDDSVLKDLSKANNLTLVDSDEEGKLTRRLVIVQTGDYDEFSLSGMMDKIKGEDSILEYLKDFERYPSVSYLTTGGYYVDNEVASKLMDFAKEISAIALVDIDLKVGTLADWNTAKSRLLGLNPDQDKRGKSAHFLGCNSFKISSYNIMLADSFNYLTSLGENIKKGIDPWLPVANDSNGFSLMGCGTTQKISTSLAEKIAEGNIGVSSNPLIYSHSLGGYKIMGNRTLLNNEGVLSPNSFLNVAVIVNRVARSSRQAANKLKLVSTDPNSTFLKFKQMVSKTIEPMVVKQNGVLEYKIRLLPKTAPSTIDIQIHLVVLEGIEKFNIYIPYELKLN